MEIEIKFEENSSLNYKVFIDELPKLEIDKRVAIITNPKIAGLHLKKLLNSLKAKEIYIITIGDGEEYKNWESINFILDRLFDYKFNRKSLLIAFGGGVIGDMTGFVASIFQRGIDFIQIPTTLLSQVDASVGGKTGINNRYGKNLIGAFHQPKNVYIDTDFLKTLPAREFSAGVAEIIKMAVIFDREFFTFLENSDLKKSEEDLKKAIKRSIELKAEIVAKDEKEGGVRASLNYGHTFCHIIENLTNYSTYLHGEAVSIGIVMANRLALKLGLLRKKEAKRVKKLLQKYNLPTFYKIDDEESFYQSFFLDKKSSDKKIKFVLPNGIGNFVFREDIEKEIILNILKKYK